MTDSVIQVVGSWSVDGTNAFPKTLVVLVKINLRMPCLIEASKRLSVPIRDEKC